MAIPDLGHQHIDAALAADTAPTTAHHRQPGAGIDASERSISTQHAYTTAAAHGGSDARRLPRMSALCICVPLMFALMLGVFAGSLSGAIITWRKYERLRDRDTWSRRSCVLVSSAVASDESARLWRAECLVRGFGLKNENETVKAFWGRNGAYSLAKSAARNLTEALPDVGSRVRCWVRRRKIREVSMREIQRKQSGSEEMFLNMAWGTSFFAALSGFLLLALCITVAQRLLLGMINADVQARHEQDERRREATKRPSVLSSTQVRFVVSQFGETLRFSTATASLKEWTCPICLEENEAAQRMRVVILPCKHQYHSRCIRRWLRRGAPTCPLCNWNVQSLFNEEGLPVDNDGNAIESPDARSSPRSTRQVLITRRANSGARSPDHPLSDACEHIAMPAAVAVTAPLAQSGDEASQAQLCQ